jgi:Zn finger protein HypA/HybF involved in hydrogenase expression
MRLLKPDEEYDGEDWAECPYCRADVVELAQDVSDADFSDDEMDVGAADCPKCGISIAVVREHSYHLRRFKQD